VIAALISKTYVAAGISSAAKRMFVHARPGMHAEARRSKRSVDTAQGRSAP